MQFPLGFWDAGLLIAITAIILLITSEFISPYHGQTNLLIEKRRMKKAAIALSVLFLLIVFLRILEIII